MVGISGTSSVPLAHEPSHISGGSDEIDSALAIAAIPVHDKNKHASRIRKIFGAVLYAFDTSLAQAITPSKLSYYIGFALPGVDDKAYANIIVPNDFVSYSKLRMIYIHTQAGASLVGDIQCNYAAHDENSAAHSASNLNHSFGTYTVNDVYFDDCEIALSSLAKGDIIGIRWNNDFDRTVFIIGFELEYNAEE